LLLRLLPNLLHLVRSDTSVHLLQPLPLGLLLLERKLLALRLQWKLLLRLLLVQELRLL
jgi:hypothetical protein